MGKITRLLLVFTVLTAVLFGCAQPENTRPNESRSSDSAENNSDVLVVYYSQSGNTQKVAKCIQTNTKGDIYQIEIENPYPDDMYETSHRAEEERNTEDYPKLKGLSPDLSQYQTIYIGGPVWSHTLASPLIRYLKDNDFTGKNIKPFWTDAGNPGNYEQEFKNYATTGNVLSGTGFSHVSSMNDDELSNKVNDWIYSKTHITLTAGDINIKAQLNDSIAAQEFKELLPITLSMTRMGEHEYYSSLGVELSEDDPQQTGYEIGDLAYWTPGNLFAIYFDEPEDEPEGLIILGEVIDDIEKIKNLENSQKITISLVNE